MILIFLILFIIFISIFQQWSLENTLDYIDGDFWPDENVINPKEDLDITVELKNKKRFPLYYVKIACHFTGEVIVDSRMKHVKENHSIQGTTAILSTWMKSHERVRLKIPVSVSQRGRYILIPPTLYLGDFLGLKECEKSLTQFREIVVAPEAFSSQEVGQVLGKFLGDYSVRRFLYEDPVLTLGYREYTGREPFKMIAWKQSAQRQQTLMVKEYDHTVEPAISVLVNVETENTISKELFEKCFSIARSVCSDLESQGISYDFYTNAQMAGGNGDMHTVVEGLGTRHFMKVMELLGRSMYTPSFSYSELLTLAETSAGKERGKIVITPQSSISAGAMSEQILVLEADLF